MFINILSHAILSTFTAFLGHRIEIEPYSISFRIVIILFPEAYQRALFCGLVPCDFPQYSLTLQVSTTWDAITWKRFSTSAASYKALWSLL